ncbi:MAG: hypothetical protein AABX23_01735 [Nanoarchaeota archaeon]
MDNSRQETIAVYERGLNRDLTILKELPSWHAEVRIQRARYFIGLDGIKETDQDARRLYETIKKIELGQL